MGPDLQETPLRKKTFSAILSRLTTVARRPCRSRQQFQLASRSSSGLFQSPSSTDHDFPSHLRDVGGGDVGAFSGGAADLQRVALALEAANGTRAPLVTLRLHRRSYSRAWARTSSWPPSTCQENSLTLPASSMAVRRILGLRISGDEIAQLLDPADWTL